MPSFHVEIEFEVYCETCGAGLCSQSTGHNSSYKNQPYVNVKPCEKCLQGKYKEGYDNGYDDGYDCGLDNGGEDADKV